MQTPEKDFLAGTTTSTLWFSVGLTAHPRAAPQAEATRRAGRRAARVSPGMSFQLATLQVPPPGTALPPPTPAPICRDGPSRREALPTPAPFAASSLGQPTQQNLTYFHCVLRKGAKIRQDCAASILRA